MKRFVFWRSCLLIVVLILVGTLIYNSLKNHLDYWYSKEYNLVWPRVMNWNLRELPEYPEVQIIYLYRVNADAENEYWQAGVYPALDEKLEKQIRKLGYPFNYQKIQYIGTDNYEDRYTYWGHPLAGTEIFPSALADAWLYPHPLAYYRKDPSLYVG